MMLSRSSYEYSKISKITRRTAYAYGFMCPYSNSKLFSKLKIKARKCISFSFISEIFSTNFDFYISSSRIFIVTPLLSYLSLDISTPLKISL